MSYKYPAATQTASSRQATSSRGRSASVATEDASAQYTRERWARAQAEAPTIQISSGSPPSSRVRFAEQPVSSSHGRHRHRADSPASQASSTPSLSHSADPEHDDDVKCPPTPEFKPLELGLEAKSSKSSRSKHKTERLPPAHAAAYSTIDQIVHEFNENVVVFKHPRELDFGAPTADPNVVPALSFTAKNKPLFEHVQRLEALQTELDGIESYGDHGIRKARKEAVVMIQHELDGLKRVQARIWNKLMHEQHKRSRRQ